MVVCAERFRRRFVEAILAGSTPVRHPKRTCMNLEKAIQF